MTHDGANGSKSKLGKMDKGKNKNSLKVHEGGVRKEKKSFFVSKLVTLRRIALKGRNGLKRKVYFIYL